MAVEARLTFDVSQGIVKSAGTNREGKHLVSRRHDNIYIYILKLLTPLDIVVCTLKSTSSSAPHIRYIIWIT